MKLSDFVVKDAIVPELKGTDRDAVIRELVEALAAAKAVDANDVEAIIKAVIQRERQGSTGMGKGVAVPHVKHAALKKRVGVVGRSTVGVDFAALDGQPVYSVLLVLSPASDPDGHLHAMETIFRNINDDRFRRFLRQSSTQQEIVELIEEADQASPAR